VYPQTATENVADIYFDTEINDPYRWLEDDNSTETGEWVKAQNAVTYNYLEAIPFRENLRKRITNLMNYPKYGSPFKKHGIYYFFKNDGLQNQSVLYRQESPDAEPEVLLDPNTFSQDGTVALANLSFSNNGKYLAYSIARSGSDWNEIFVIDLATRELLSEHLEWVKFSGISWQGDGFYYSAYDAPEVGKELTTANEFQKVYYHKIGDGQSKDVIIYRDDKHPLRGCGAGVTEDERYLFISENESTSGNSLKMKDLGKPQSDFITLVDDFDSDNSIIDHVDGKLYILTNWDAPKQRLMEIDPAKPARKDWKEVLSESENVLTNVSIIGGKIIAVYMQDATDHAYVYDLQGTKLYEIDFPTLGTVGGFSGNKNESEAFYVFASYTFPGTIYRFNVENNTSELFRASEIDFNADEYLSEQVFYTSKDGTKVPMSVIYKKGLQKDGNNPVFLYGYGGFNVSQTPGFSVLRIPFLENGGIIAIANLRGGGEYGEAWHKAGTKMQKQNVFDDFIAAAEYLVAEKFTNAAKIAINGGSNGGLLVGACMLQRPDLFAVAVPEVGVLDMLRYHKFTIGWAWATDYGTSEESKEMFDYLLGYSPLHNVKQGVKYPATFVMTGDHDDRVVPAHSFKFAATLQAANDGSYPSLIRIDVDAGHGAGKPISKTIDAQTDKWAFIMYHLGMNPVGIGD
jgi:prolyl oligopeptidase